MKDRYLEITYRNGKPFAAYLYLNRKVGTKSSKTKKISDGLVADFDDRGNVIGLEIISPLTTNTSDINKALKSLESTTTTRGGGLIYSAWKARHFTYIF